MDEKIINFYDNEMLNRKKNCDDEIKRSLERIDSERKMSILSNEGGISEFRSKLSTPYRTGKSIDTKISINCNYYQNFEYLKNRSLKHNPYIKNTSEENTLKRTGKLIMDDLNCNKKYELVSPQKNEKIKYNKNNNINLYNNYYSNNLNNNQNNNRYNNQFHNLFNNQYNNHNKNQYNNYNSNPYSNSNPYRNNQYNNYNSNRYNNQYNNYNSNLYNNNQYSNYNNNQNSIIINSNWRKKN